MQPYSGTISESVNIRPHRVIVAVGGGIAAYKICEVVSTLFKMGVELRVIMTNAAQKFIMPLTFATLSRHPVYTDKNFWQPNNSPPLHIKLGEWADLCLIAPLTANTLGKLTHGIADNLLTNTVLASTCPVLLVPAMNTNMWGQQIVKNNWQHLLSYERFHSTEIASGLLACDHVGAGRMAEPVDIISHIQSLLHTKGKQDLIGKTILISAGKTREFMDPVRFIGNPSTGKMGIAIARAAIHRGAKVILVHGEVIWEQPLGIQTVLVVSAEQMHQEMLRHLPNADVIIMSAAVADVKPRDHSTEKLPKQLLPTSLPLVRVPDILADLAYHKKPNQKLIGFAAQTGDIIAPALEKLRRKNLDLIVANPIDRTESGFGNDNNQGTLIDKKGNQQKLPLCSKLQMAHYLFDFVGENIYLG
ncbi:bifunctional phosphopantothenoylcysteine decarboxylase/phosphopantothenate--cysteine ligase CoaBC [Richelia intracellularis]|uniref:bifunctional phosphopantothenoylcysteine decarboxylase/phosphopantothenate--cysteine ligase CoaBC n=1 Tax=Richelia intracellularis TaxID=1164990 RepID=UPI0005C5F092|nr:bifunctional phosphopantothenoylcysteine decarboxylase/phosphopantothenate--cysteine ligase CoaBC [Richelia intracellularis]